MEKCLNKNFKLKIIFINIIFLYVRIQSLIQSEKKYVLWKQAGKNPYWEYIEKNIGNSLDRYDFLICRNPNMTPDLLEKYTEYYADFFIPDFQDDNPHLNPILENDTEEEYISDDPEKSLKILLSKNEPDINLYRNPNITEDIFESYPELYIDYFPHFIFGNPNLNLDRIDIFIKMIYSGEDLINRNPVMYIILKNKFLYNSVVNRRGRAIDIKIRRKQFKKLFEPVSIFSRNIDKVIGKRLSYY